MSRLILSISADVGRNKVDEHEGIQTLLTLLRSLLSNTEEGADKLRTIACGFLLNLTNTHGKMTEIQNTIYTLI